ncbi:MAG: DUF1638 domain-containing protein [Pseudomonadota bacterium]
MDDVLLTQDGRTPEAQGSILLLACGALAREIVALRDDHAWRHLDLACLPAILHNTPDAIPKAVEDAVQKHRSHYDQIFVVYADCGTGGRLQATCDRLGVTMIEGPHCYSFFEGNDAFATRHETEFTAFYLTDFLVRQFDAFVMRPLGLDRHPELRDMYFGHYETLVYQAQTDDPALTAKAEDCARILGLDFQRRFTGYGDLEHFLARL